MIDLFVVHSGCDSNYVLEKAVPALVNSTENESCHTNILILGSNQYVEKYSSVKKNVNTPNCFEVRFTGNNWKKDAKKCINLARAVLVIVGEDTYKKKDSMGFEVEYARKKGKLILLHKISPDIEIPSFLKTKDQFTGKTVDIAQPQSLEDIRKRIDDFDLGYYDIFNNNEKKDGDIGRIMEQYKMYQKTSEDLVSRRQSVSSFYLSANSAIVAIYGVVLGLVKAPNNIYVLVLLAIVGLILDISWIKILDAYGQLNAAKMKVISMMERELPIRLYDTEWAVMSDKLNKKRYVSFTDSEKRIPKIFMGIYCIILIASIVVTLVLM